MENTSTAPRGMVVTPHHLATQSALAILREGGSAMEATIAAAATMAVVYPQHNSIGGDSFWLIVPPKGDPLVIEACGAAGSKATLDFYAGLDRIPYSGPKSACTVAGTVGGWQEALQYVSECGYNRFSLARLLSDAIYYAENGYPVTSSQECYLEQIIAEEELSNEFKEIFVPVGRVPKAGKKIQQKRLAETLKSLVENGLNCFYRGDVAKRIAEDMESLGMPITASDLQAYYPIRKKCLTLNCKYGQLLNTPPPTQGLVSMSILGILTKLDIDGKHAGEFIHTTVEATKQAFELRDQYLTDPKYMHNDAQTLISEEAICKMAQNINPNRAKYVGKGKGSGGTIWMGIMDNKGFSVSFIQSIYHKFGSKVLLPKTGILWQNRGTSFSLKKNQLLSLKPGKKPFHTLNPAAALLNDGRVMVYGSQGGDGQGQTQAAIFHRYVVQGLSLQKAVSAPRWLYGRTTGDYDDTLKLEDRFSEETVWYLKERGHDVVLLPCFSDKVGEAGALVRNKNGMIEGAFDRRSNGSAAGF